jgi:hypothetical protein
MISSAILLTPCATASCLQLDNILLHVDSAQGPGGRPMLKLCDL